MSKYMPHDLKCMHCGLLCEDRVEEVRRAGKCQFARDGEHSFIDLNEKAGEGYGRGLKTESVNDETRSAIVDSMNRSKIADPGKLLMTNMPIATMQARIHQQNKEMGWWDTPREHGTLLMLIVSEVVEAFEGVRKNLMDDHLPHRIMEEVELADAMIRIMDYAASKNYDLAGAIVEKVDYNRTRPDHQPGARAEAHGKKF